MRFSKDVHRLFHACQGVGKPVVNRQAAACGKPCGHTLKNLIAPRYRRGERKVYMGKSKLPPLTPEQQLAAKNRETALHYKLVCTLSRNLHCDPEEAMRLLELPGSIRKQILARITNETKKGGK